MDTAVTIKELAALMSAFIIPLILLTAYVVKIQMQTNENTKTISKLEAAKESEHEDIYDRLDRHEKDRSLHPNPEIFEIQFRQLRSDIHEIKTDIKRYFGLDKAK
jgi:hypothetical protein